MLLINKFLLAILIIQSRVACKKISNQASKLLEKEASTRTKTSCKSTATTRLMRLRAEENNDKLISCLIKALHLSSENAFFWSLLGETYDKTGQKSKANACFKEATKFGGKVSDYIKEWDFIGPFTIGKSEVDGDPLEEWGGVSNVSKYRWHKDFVLCSELSSHGEVKWTRVQASANRAVQITPKVDWNELVMSLQSMGITEWQGWAFGDLVTNEDGTLTVQCLSVNTMYIDGKLMNGDVYRRDDFWFPVLLQRGIHTLQVKLRAKGPQVFQCNIRSFSSSYPFKLINPPFLPDLVGGQIFGKLIPLPVNNLQSSKWLKILKVSIVDSSYDKLVTVKLFKQSKDVSVAPGQVRTVILELKYKSDPSEKKAGCKDLALTLKVTANNGKSQQVAIKLRCRKLKESFLFTFLDHDGSVQHGAAILPLKPCKTSKCPVLLTLHGTTVPPQNQADSYKRMVDGKWVFGVEHLWVLAPTRHGAHNWEGPGELTAMSALKNFAKLTEETSLTVMKADAEHVVFAGHSMGGHGAWQVGIHYPDQALAVISMAGWNKKEDYGDSNLFFRHDISTSHTDPSVKWILEACVAENDADKHTSNLHGIPIMIRTGAADKTVHPYYARRMYRLLREQQSNVTYSELSGKEHWWWDTFSTNDGGVVNDPVIRKFAIEHAREASYELQACDVEKKEKHCVESEPKESKYTNKKQLRGRNSFGDSTFILTVYNPASSTGLRGVRVFQQTVPFRKSTVVISLKSDSASLITVNVERLSISEPSISPVHWQHKSLKVDNVEFSSQELKEAQGNILHFCSSKSSRWLLCENTVESSSFRGPSNMGPARRIAERPFIIVTGTNCDENTETTLLNFAVYIANLFYLTSDGLSYVIKDTELNKETADHYNLIIIGNPQTNSWSQKFHDNIPLKYNDNQMRLGDCHFQLSRTGAVFLSPHTGNHLALVISGNSLDGIRDAVQLASPTIPPMTRSPFSNMVPDYVITGPRFGALGPGGYLCSGFWGNRWEYRRDVCSCAC